MEIKDMITADFVNKEMVKDNPTNLYLIIGGGKRVMNEKYEKEELHLPVMLKDEKYTFAMRAMNLKIVSEVLGTETDKWIGNALQLTIVPELKDAIKVSRVVKQEELTN